MYDVCIKKRSGLRQDGTPPPKKHTRNCLEVMEEDRKLDANARRLLLKLGVALTSSLAVDSRAAFTSSAVTTSLRFMMVTSHASV